MATYYKYSGKFTPQGVLFGLLSGAVASVPLAFLYDYGIVGIPEAKLRGICTLTFGALVGAASGAAMFWGKVRNKWIAATVGFATSLFGLYLSWFAWVLHLLHPNKWVFGLVRPASHPLGLWKAMLAVNPVGTWTYGSGSSPEHGTFLWLVWAAEALLIVLAGAVTSLILVQLHPFCERCEQWCSSQTKLYFAPSLPAGQFKIHLETSDLTNLQKLPAGNKKQAHYRVDIHACANCQSLNTLSLVQNFPRDRKTIVNKLLITPEQAAAIRNLLFARQTA